MITSASQKSCTLGTLLDGVTNIPIENDIEISGFSLDSRHVQAGQVFVGLPGNDTDGRGYIDQAVNAGAAADSSVPLGPVSSGHSSHKA